MILITGATGTTGSKVLDILLKRLPKVRILTHDPVKLYHMPADPGFEVVVGDLRKPESLAPALSGVEKVFLLSPAEPGMVTLQTNLISMARKNGVKHIVKVSTLGADPHSEVPFFHWHAAAEKALEASKIPYTHLRPNFYMQNFLYFFAPVIEECGEFHANAGNGRVSAVDVRDVAGVACEVLLGTGHEGKTYEITGPEALSFAQMAEILSNQCGREIRYVPLSDEDARQELRASSSSEEWMTNALVPMYRFFAEGKGSTVNRIVTDLTGASPRRFDAFCSEYSAAFRRAAA